MWICAVQFHGHSVVEKRIQRKCFRITEQIHGQVKNTAEQPVAHPHQSTLPHMLVIAQVSWWTIFLTLGLQCLFLHYHRLNGNSTTSSATFAKKQSDLFICDIAFLHSSSSNTRSVCVVLCSWPAAASGQLQHERRYPVVSTCLHLCGFLQFIKMTTMRCHRPLILRMKAVMRWVVMPER